MHAARGVGALGPYIYVLLKLIPWDYIVTSIVTSISICMIAA